MDGPLDHVRLPGHGLLGISEFDFSSFPAAKDFLVMFLNYPSIQKKISIQDIQVSGYQKKVVSTHP